MADLGRREFLLTTLTAALVPGLSFGEDKPAAPAAAAQEKWRSLFDGKTLKDWKTAEFGHGGTAKVDNGLLVIGKGEPLSGIVWSGEAIPKINYEMRLMAQRVEGDDFFCALTFPVKKDPCSLVLGGWGGGVVGLSSLNGYDASENETTGYFEFEKKKWYAIRLVVIDGRIAAWVDDHRIVNVETEDKKISIRIEVEPCVPFGVATFRTTGAIKDFKVRELSAEEVKTINKEQAE